MIKSSSMRIRLDPKLHNDFLTSCKQRDIPAAQVLRDYMRDFVARNPPFQQGELLVAEEKGYYTKTPQEQK